MAVSQEKNFINITVLVGILQLILFSIYLFLLEKKRYFQQAEFFVPNGQFPCFLPRILARRMGPEGASHGLHLKLSSPTLDPFPWPAALR